MLAPKGSKDKCKDQPEKNLSLTCQHGDKKKAKNQKEPLSFSSALLYLTALKGHSKPGRETVKALSVSLSCNSVTGWAVWGDERSMFMSNPGPWSRLLHSQVLPLLTASPPPPPTSVWKTEGISLWQRQKFGGRGMDGGGYLNYIDYRGIIESFGQPGHWRWVFDKLSDLWSVCNPQSQAFWSCGFTLHFTSTGVKSVHVSSIQSIISFNVEKLKAKKCLFWRHQKWKYQSFPVSILKREVL